MCKKVLLVTFLLCTVLGCKHQLPQTQFPINQVPKVFDEASIISSVNGIIAMDISKIPGTVCIPNPKNLCTAGGLIAGQYLSEGAKIDIKPTTTQQPTYHALINDKYSVTLNVPFVTPTLSDEYYDEIRATTVATAVIAEGAPNAGFPGIQAIKNALLTARGISDVPVVYWISAANVISVSKTTFQKVSSSVAVSYSGFGANGSTYNNRNEDSETIWIGVFAHRIDLKGEPSPIPVQKSFLMNLNLNKLPPLHKSQIFDLDANGLFKR